MANRTILNSNRILYNVLTTLNYKRFSTEQSALPQLDEAVRSDIENEKKKPRKHPGVSKVPTCSLPDKILKAISIIIEEHPVKPILKDAKTLTNYLYSRHYPLEDEDIKEKKEKFRETVKNKLGELPADATEEQATQYSRLVTSAVSQLMVKYSYRWSPLDLQDYSSLVYLFTRAAPNYAAVMRVFHEITKQCPEYRPTSVFDFGSGVGTVSWAAESCWGQSVKQYMNVDSSGSINALASLVLQGGDAEASLHPGVYYRQFLPAQHVKHSMVVSAHSLMELPSRVSRLDTLMSLWHKTEDFLVIIEQGTKPGFKVVSEARDFILSYSQSSELAAHVLAPCPHDNTCPRVLKGPYPCHFTIQYFDIPVGKKQELKKELLSYVIIRKGKREKGNDWPRVVRPVLKRHNHVVCRMCSPHGDLREVIFTKNKHGKVLYKCAKVTSWGDLLPVHLPAESPQDCQPETSDDEAKPD